MNISSQIKKITDSILFQAVMVTAIAYGLTYVTIYFTSLSFLSPIETQQEYVVYDKYNAVLSHRAVKQSSDVVIVTTDDLNRNGIGDLVETIAEYCPKVVGVDVLFPMPQDQDSILLRQLTGCPNIVLACNVKYDETNGVFHSDKGSYFEPALPVEYGAVNLAANNLGDVIRCVKPFFRTDYDTIPSFAMAIAKRADAATARTWQMSHAEQGFIQYPSIQIDTISGLDVLHHAVDSADIHGKIILLGDMRNRNDAYITPVDVHMMGVMIHALSVHTILTDPQIAPKSSFFNWMIAILAGLAFSIVSLVTKKYFPNIGGLVLRLFQFVMLLCLILIGIKYYMNYIYIDSSPTLIMIALCAFAIDLWSGIYFVIKKLFALI